MKTRLEWFRHPTDASSREAMAKLRKEYGWEGAGKYWALLEIIARSDFCTLDISDAYKQEGAARGLDLGTVEFDKFLGYLEAAGLVKRKGTKVQAPEITDQLPRIMRQRERVNKGPRKPLTQAPRIADNKPTEKLMAALTGTLRRR